MTHRDTVIDADRVELEWDSTGLPNRLLDEFADLVQVHVPRYDFDKRVRNRNKRLPEVLIGLDHSRRT
jgi:hypothetical protein